MICNFTDKYKAIENEINSTYENLFQSMRQLYDTYAPEREVDILIFCYYLNKISSLLFYLKLYLLFQELDELDLPYEEFKEQPMKPLQARADENVIHQY